MFPVTIQTLAKDVVALCSEKKLMIATAESCTGGLVAAALTEIPGSSACLAGGFVTYSDFMKRRVLGVNEDALLKFGAVSEEVAREMAAGTLKAATADLSVAVTGIAGPSGGSPEKPVGTVHFATARRSAKGIETHHERHYVQESGRQAIRLASVEIALELLKRQAGAF